MNDITWIGSPNHYNGRNGLTITHITLHIMVGHLTGTDNTFKHPGGASAHYGIGADGTIHQYVNENDGSWSDANYTSNNSTISIEHEGGMNGIPCTKACMDASAQLCADIAQRQGWTHLQHNGLTGNIWLHREIPGTDHAGCPDLAPNGLDIQYIINKANQILEGNNMPNAQEIAEAVWNFNQNGVKCRDRLQGIDEATNNTGNKTWQTEIQGIQARDRLYGLDSIQIPQLTTQVTALSAAVKALSESMGANPDTIAKTVQEAVKAKLDSLHITVTDKQ